MTIQNNYNEENILKEKLLVCKKAFSYNFIFSLLINVMMLSTSLYSLQVLDRVLSSGSFETLIMLSIIMIVIYIALALIQTIRSIVFTHIANWLDTNLASILLKNSISFHSQTKGSQNLRDLSVLKTFITGQPLISVFDAPWSIIYFFVIFIIHYILGIIAVAGALILFILALLNEKYTKTKAEKANEINVISMNKVDAIARNSEVIKAMGMQEEITKAWQNINQDFIKKNTSFLIRNHTISSITKSVRLFIQMSLMAMGAVLVIRNQMSAGGIIAVSILSGKALAPFDMAVAIYKSIIGVQKSYGRLKGSLKDYQKGRNGIKLPEPEGMLDIERIFYKLPNSEQFIIKGINIKIQAGEIIVVIGNSGSGKTTLARLIAGILKPTKGSVRIDRADITLQGENYLGKYIGFLPQDIELFDASIKDNIARMNTEAASETIIQASVFTHIHEFILSLPNAYETNATYLSAGQRQRIALARSFYGNPKVVILDEPNSNLDTEGEIALAKTIANAKKEKITTIIISHKTSVLNSADKILLLKDGEVKVFDETKKVIKSLIQKPTGQIVKEKNNA